MHGPHARGGRNPRRTPFLDLVHALTDRRGACCARRGARVCSNAARPCCRIRRSRHAFRRSPRPVIRPRWRPPARRGSHGASWSAHARRGGHNPRTPRQRARRGPRCRNHRHRVESGRHPVQHRGCSRAHATARCRGRADTARAVPSARGRLPSRHVSIRAPVCRGLVVSFASGSGGSRHGVAGTHAGSVARARPIRPCAADARADRRP